MLESNQRTEVVQAAILFLLLADYVTSTAIRAILEETKAESVILVSSDIEDLRESSIENHFYELIDNYTVQAALNDLSMAVQIFSQEIPKKTTIFIEGLTAKSLSFILDLVPLKNFPNICIFVVINMPDGQAHMFVDQLYDMMTKKLPLTTAMFLLQSKTSKTTQVLWNARLKPELKVRITVNKRTRTLKLI